MSTAPRTPVTGSVKQVTESACTVWGSSRYHLITVTTSTSMVPCLSAVPTGPAYGGRNKHLFTGSGDKQEEAEEASVGLYADAGAEHLMELLCSSKSSQQPHHHCLGWTIQCYFFSGGALYPKAVEMGRLHRLWHKGKPGLFFLSSRASYREPEQEERVSRRLRSRLVGCSTKWTPHRFRNCDNYRVAAVW